MWIFKKKTKEVQIFAPVNGKVIGLDLVEDDVFKEKMMGDGFAIDPTDGEFVAPMDGELVTAFPTKHAYGIKHKTGIELLLHIGLDTVTLNGQGFTSYVEQGQNVHVGDKLVDVDLKKIKTKVPSIKTPIVFTNDMGKTINLVKTGAVKKGDLIAIIK